MLPLFRSWPSVFSRTKAGVSPVRVGVAIVSLVVLGLGGWLLGHQLGVQANPSVNGVCDGVDRCLEPTEVSTFVGRAIEPDPDQAVGSHEWDFTGTGSFSTEVKCTGSACTQPCNDGDISGSHNDCSITDFSYSDPAFFASTNERKLDVGLRGVDTEGAAGVAQTREVGVAIAYVGPDRGSSALGVSGLSAGGFTVGWRDVTDVPGSAYTLHVDNLDDSTSDLISVTNDKAIGETYSVAYVAEPLTNYLVWAVVYYPTPNGSIVRQNLPPSDSIMGVPVSTPANAAPTLAIARIPGNVPPAATPPHYLLLRQAGNVLTLNITASDADGDQLAELRIDGLTALSGASFTGFSTPTAGPVTRTMTWNMGSPLPASGDYSVTVVARDVVGGTTSQSLVIRLNSNPDAPASLQVNTNDASAGLASGDPTPVAQVVDDNLADQNLKFTYRHNDPDGDAATMYHLLVDTDSGFGSPIIWDSGNQNLAVNSGSRSGNITYVGPRLSYATDYWWRVQGGDTNGNLSDWGKGRFKMRPTNYTPDLGLVNATYSVDVGNTLTVNLTATDQDIVDGLPQTLTFFAQGGLPSSRMGLNPNTGVFTFIPNSSDLTASPYTITFCVRDSYAPPAQDCGTPTTITVNLNLAPPTGLNVNFTSPVAGTANWTHSAVGEDGFQLDATAPVSSPNLAEVAANITNASLAFNRCDSTSTVSFQVRAFVDPGGPRQFSAAATASVLLPGFAAPTGLSVSAIGNTSARISWTPGTTGQSGYAVYSGIVRQTPDADAGATSYDVIGLTPGNNYTFTVRPFVSIASCSPSQVLGGSASINWTQPNPGVTITPATTAFGNVAVGTNSATQNIQVRNSGSVALTLTASLIGADAGQFTLINTPPASLAVGATWNAQVEFRPTAYGAKTAQLQVAAVAFGLNVTSNLTGTGVPVTPVITAANWVVNEPSRYNAAWTWGPGNPDDFSLQLPSGTEQLRVADGSLRSQNNQLLTQCYTVTSTPNSLNVLAYAGGVFSTPATADLGLRPGWEAMGSPTFSWLSNTSARLSWSDPAPIRSSYEIRVWNGATPVLSVTSTDDVTSMDLTGLVAGTNYTVTVRPFRGSVDLPGCSASTVVYGSRLSLSYRQPVINLEVHIQGTPVGDVALTELDGGGVWIGDDLTFPLRIHNSGDAMTITGSSYSVAGGNIVTGGILSSVWPSPFGAGADWNTNVQFQAVAITSDEVVVNVQLAAGLYGQVLDFPVRVVPLLDGPGVSREIFATQAVHNGDFGTAADAQLNANDFCQSDSRANPSKRYKALLWFSNNPTPGVVAAGTLYRNSAGQFVFGTRPGDTTLPYTAHRSIADPGQSVWTGRGIGMPAYNCTDWTSFTGWGASGGTNDLARWSLAYPGQSNCQTVSKPVYCVEVPATPGEQIVVTAASHQGNLAIATDLGGSTWYERANDFCQKDVRTSDNWEWRALLWGGTIPTTLQQTVIQAGHTYYNQNDAALFTAASDNDVPTNLSAAVGSGNVYTGNSYGTCYGTNTWTSNQSTNSGGSGNANATDPTWFNTGSGITCVAGAQLYCVQQPVPAKRIRVTSGSIPGNGGFGANAALPGSTWWEKANSICSTDGTWKALIWGDASLPPVAQNGNITHANTLYVTEDGHRLFTADSDNYVPATLSWPVQTSISHSMATGYNNATNDCGGAGGPWTVGLSTASQVRGLSNQISTAWLVNGTNSCGVASYLYCVEQ